MSQTLNVNASGIYSVTVTDSLGCSTTDSIDVTLNPPAIAGNISVSGGDTILCGNEYAWFYSNGHSGNVLWWVMDTMNWVWMPFSSGDTVDFGITPNGISGYYQFLITTINGSCPPDTADILTVEMRSSPEPTLPTDGIYCTGGFFIDAGYAGLQHLWNDNSTSQFLQINSSGTYFVTVTDSVTGCSGSDTANYVVPIPIVVTFNPMPDTICMSDPPFLLTGSPAGGIFAGFGVNGNMYDPALASPGTWMIQYYVMDSINCAFWDADTITILACVGIVESSDSPMKIYPNPAYETLTLEISFDEYSVEILDAQCRLVTADLHAQDKLAIDVQNLECGLYFIRVTETGSGEVRYTQFVKSNSDE